MYHLKETWRFCISLLAGLAMFLSIGVSHGNPNEKTSAKSKTKKGSTVWEQALSGPQQELLDMAFETATMIPPKPHIKDRSRAQQEVVLACLELNAPERALAYLKRIENWRKGLCYAHLAFHLVERDKTAKVQNYLDLAAKLAEETEDWRRDRIRVKIAQTHAWLGNIKKAEQFEAGAVSSETGKVDRVKARISEIDSFQEQMAALEQNILTGDFDIIKNTLQAYAQLFNRFYSEKEKREKIVKKIKDSWGTIPIFIRFDLLIDLATYALDHSNRSHALAFANEAEQFIHQYNWKLEHRIPLMAQLAEVRHRAGEKTKAKELADKALALFKEKGKTIVNIWRAGALRPLAEAYQCMNHAKPALSVYQMAIEEGVANPNSRPRAEDLAATCTSMALHRVKPSKQLWARIQQIHGGLGQPW